jgi:hypothetical protein
MVHEPIGQWGTDHGTATESHDRHAGSEAAAIRKPAGLGEDPEEAAIRVPTSTRR